MERNQSLYCWSMCVTVHCPLNSMLRLISLHVWPLFVIWVLLLFWETVESSILITSVWVCVTLSGQWLEDVLFRVNCSPIPVQHPQRFGSFPKINQVSFEKNTDMLYSAAEAQPKQNTLVSLWRKNDKDMELERWKKFSFICCLSETNWACSPC